MARPTGHCAGWREARISARTGSLAIRRRRTKGALAFLQGAGLLLPFAVSLAAAHADVAFLDRGLLWRVVHQVCVPGAQHGNPAPCSLVDVSNGEDKGIAVLPVPLKKSEILIVPTRRITGIESPLLRGAGPNYWNESWQQRPLLEARAGHKIDRDWIGMAVNSQFGRSQDQLHIHLDCIRPDVRNTLKANEARPRLGWSTITFSSIGHTYYVRRVVGADLSEVDPFRIASDEIPDIHHDLGPETIVVVGARFSDQTVGFYVLAHRSRVSRGDYGSGVELLDRSCSKAP